MIEVKGNMKAGLKVAALVLLVAVLSVSLTGEALAMPKGLSAKLKWDVKYDYQKGIWDLKVTIKNTSKDRVVTQLSDFKGSATFTVSSYIKSSKSGGYNDKFIDPNVPNHQETVKLSLNSNKTHKVELEPGESKTYTWQKEGKVSGLNPKAKLDKWSFDCSSKTKKY
jgi:hypothetical protein